MIISREHGFIFVHIQKTAGESVSSSLEPHLGLFDVIVGLPKMAHSDTAAQRARRFGLWKHSTAAEIRQALGAETWNSWKSFCIVRDPVQRAASFYAYLLRVRQSATPSLRQRLMGRGIDRRRQPWNWPDIQVLDETADFSSFIRHEKFGVLSGTRPQIEFISENGRIIVDRVVQFEKLALEWPSLCNWLGLSGIELGHDNRGSEKMISAHDAAYLRDFYASDYAALGY